MAGEWYLGPLGDLRELPCPELDVQLTTTRYGGIHQSLSGARHMDVTGLRSEYVMEFKYLDKDEYRWLEALHTRLIPGPVRLINPLKKNRLSLAASTLQGNNYLGAGIQIDSQLWEWDWDWPSAAGPGARSMKIENWDIPYALRFDRKIRVPVTVGEPVTWSVWMKASAAQTVQVIANWWNRDTQLSGSALTNASVTTSWTRFTATGTPPSGAFSAQPALVLPTDTGETIWIAAPQFEVGSSASDWEIGGGAPEVLVDQVPLVSHRFPLVNASVTLLES